MLRWVFSFLSLAAAAQAPFWKAKAKVYERVKNGEIIVSVKPAKGRPPFAHSLQITGGGHVAAPKAFVFQYAQDFDRVARLSGFIEKSVYHKENGVLDLDLAALGHRAHVEVMAKAMLTEPPRIEFEIIKGPMHGLRSRIDFTALGPRATEVGMEGGFDYDRFPIPRVFLQFGLEVVFQKMAARLRSEVQEAAKAQGDGHT